MKLSIVSALVLGTALAAGSAYARPNAIQGSSNGLNWTASNMVVGQTSTATLAGGGDPIYFPTYPEYSGVAALIMEYDDGRFICSGSLLPDRQSILTAAHCVSDGVGGLPNKVTAWFYEGPDPDQVVPFFTTPRKVNAIAVNPLYTGEVIDENDIAVLRLSSGAPVYAPSYELYTDDDLLDAEFNVAGYGARSLTGGAVGADLGTGRLRQGDNIYSYAFGDPEFAGFWDGFFGSAPVTNSWVSDFDNGRPENDTSCFIAFVLGTSPGFGCEAFLGETEVGVAGGDSGGPQFIDGKIASVTSYGLTFGFDFGDFDDELNSSWGEFSGYVPVYLHTDFIEAQYVPTPATLALFGFGVAGLAQARRRRG